MFARLGIHPKIFVALLAGGLLGVLAVLPYAFVLVSDIVPAPGTPSLPLPIIILLALVQNGLLLAIAIGVGFALARRIGIQMPLLNAWLAGGPPADWRRIVLPALGWGLATGIVLVAIEAGVFASRLPPALLLSDNAPAWMRLLGGVVYGGLTEELLMRLFLVSLFAWLAGLIWKTPEGQPARGAFWLAIVLVSILFGLGHLPATSLLTPLTPLVVVRALVLNGIAGLVYGYLYSRRGLEAAMVAHASTHLVLQIPGALLIRLLLSKAN